MQKTKNTFPALLFAITGLLALIVYGRTMAPTITWHKTGVDSGELATAVAVGGVPHPPGYPTYLLLGEIFKQLPFGDVAYRLNLLSATCAALAVALTGLIIRHTLLNAVQRHAPLKIGQNQHLLINLCAASAALTLAFANIVWSQAVITEVYAVTLLCAALLIYTALQVTPSNQSRLGPALFCLLGISLGSHYSILLLTPLLIWLPKIRWRKRLGATVLLAFCVGVSTYAIIPIRAAALPPLNWGVANNWPNFLWLVSGGPYEQFVYATPWHFIPNRIVAGLYMLADTFMWWGLPVGLLGMFAMLRYRRKLGIGTFITFGLVFTYAIGYNTTDSYIYLLPALLIFSVWIGWGFFELGRAVHHLPVVRSRHNYIFYAGLISLPLLSLLLNFSDQDMSRNQAALTYAQENLQIAEPNAIIITDNDPHTFALWYGRYGLAQRSDVAIINIHLLPYGWYRQTLRSNHARLHLTDPTGSPALTISALVTLNLADSPIYLSTHKPPHLTGYRLEPANHLQQVVPIKSR